jgi:2-oxoglutarate ferredoxin oxidoreductase subunit beta
MMADNINLEYTSTWCPGCGNFGIINALKKAIAEVGLDLEQTALVAGIGCSSKICQYVNMYRIETLHGRTLPVATGIKLANHKLSVIVAGGDGDGMGIGMGHFIHTARRNLDLAYFIHNNQIYGLTKGQASPTSDLGAITKFTPGPVGNVEHPINIVSTAISAGATFVARGFTGQIAQLADLMAQAIRHPGFAVLDILQPCVSFNHLNTYAWYRERIIDLESLPGYDPSSQEAAASLGRLWGNQIPVGVFFRKVQPTFADSLPQLADHALVEKSLEGISIKKLMDELA